jgi:hypothetical protein
MTKSRAARKDRRDRGISLGAETISAMMSTAAASISIGNSDEIELKSRRIPNLTASGQIAQRCQIPHRKRQSRMLRLNGLAHGNSKREKRQ